MPTAAIATSPAQGIPYAFAKANGVLVAGDEGAAVVVLVRPDATVEGLAEVRRVLRRPLLTKPVDAAEFAAALSRAYSTSGTAQAIHDELARDTDLASLMQELPPAEDLLADDGAAPVIRMINALLLQALAERASDVHFEPYEARSVVRFRVDGVLRDVIEPPRALHAALVSRVKIMASLDIAEKRLPQDGRIALKLAGRSVDVRVSTLPTGSGERVVLRLLDQDAARLDLATLGMSATTLAAIDGLIREPHGILLVTGPTGSGKTTTLYAALSRLPRGSVNLMTVEDPIEYALDGVAQTQVNARIELTFARALRSILRQDPDVVMIGEIRDLETAQIAVQASLTGHLVLATLHTNDAASAVTRLADMGVEPYLARVEPARRARAAARAHALPRLPRARRGDARGARTARADGPAGARGPVRAEGLRVVPRHRLPGPHGDLRAHGRGRDPAAAHPRPRVGGEPARRRRTRRG